MQAGDSIPSRPAPDGSSATKSSPRQQRLQRAHSSNLSDNAEPEFNSPIPPRSLSKRMHHVASYKTLDSFETTKAYESRGFNLATLLRSAGQDNLEDNGGESAVVQLWEWHAEKGILHRVSDWGNWIACPLAVSPSSGDGVVHADLGELLLSSTTLYDPVHAVLNDTQHKGQPLSDEEVLEFKRALLEEFRLPGGRPLSAAAESDYLAQEASPAIVSGPEHAVTRSQIRLANRKLADVVGGVSASADEDDTADVSAKPNDTIRTWFSGLGLQARPKHTCAQVDGSPLLLGTGPNGGHDPPGHLFKVISDSYDKNLTRNMNKRVSPAVCTLMLHGEDINKSVMYSESRDTEIAGFLIDLLEMQVKTVVANGFVNAHEEDNVKGLIRTSGPYCNLKKILPQDTIGKGTFKGNHPSYRFGAARDFFNYFGSPQGDDGLKWVPIPTRHGGIASWEAKVHPLTLRSTMMAEDHALGPADGSYKVAVFKLEVSWFEGFLWFGKHQTAEIQVIHIQVQDQAPAQLTRQQVRLLYNAVAGNSVDSVKLGFERTGRTYVHCHAGIGRTGNIAFGLSELLCTNVPRAPSEKLAWLRKHRPGAIQTAEQLIDGLQLATVILDEVFERVRYSPLARLQMQKQQTKHAMEEGLLQASHSGSVWAGLPVKQVPLSIKNVIIRVSSRPRGSPIE